MVKSLLLSGKSFILMKHRKVTHKHMVVKVTNNNLIFTVVRLQIIGIINEAGKLLDSFIH